MNLDAFKTIKQLRQIAKSNPELAHKLLANPQVRKPLLKEFRRQQNKAVMWKHGVRNSGPPL